MKLFRFETILLLVAIFIFSNVGFSQTNVETDSIFSLKDYKRKKNVVIAGVGTSVINGDFENPLFEIYSQIGYKRYLNKSLNLSFVYHKFNLAYEDLFNEGFMSFDLNLGIDISPARNFSPYLFGGVGLNASNYFKQIAMKLQGGLGFEVLVSENVGLKIFADYNIPFSDELDGLEVGGSNDTFIRAGLGLNYYFGAKVDKPKLDKGSPSIISSFPIDDDN